MSFGFSAGDFVTIPGFAWQVYKSCKDSSDDFKSLSTHVAALHTVLKEIEDQISEQTPNMILTERLTTLGETCRGVLIDIESLLRKYASLESQTQRVWDRMRWGLEDIRELRGRLVSSITLLTAFNASLTNSSQIRIERKLECLLAEMKAGKRDGSIVSANTIESLSADDKAAWKQLRSGLEDYGITTSMFLQHRTFIVAWFQKAIKTGAFQEDGAEQLETVHQSYTDSEGVWKHHGNIPEPASQNSNIISSPCLASSDISEPAHIRSSTRSSASKSGGQSSDKRLGRHNLFSTIKKRVFDTREVAESICNPQDQGHGKLETAYSMTNAATSSHSISPNNTSFIGDTSSSQKSPDVRGKAVALYDSTPSSQNELTLIQGRLILVLRRHCEGWLYARDSQNRSSGIVPEEFVLFLKTNEESKIHSHSEASADEKREQKTDSQLARLLAPVSNHILPDDLVNHETFKRLISKHAGLYAELSKLKQRYVDIDNALQQLRERVTTLGIYDDQGFLTFSATMMINGAAVTKQMISAGLDINALDVSGSTVLHRACDNRKTQDVILSLLELGADVTIKDNHGKTPLQVAVTRQDPNIVHQLLSFLPVDSCNFWKSTILHDAAWREATGVTKLLLDYGADTSVIDERGATALHIAAKIGSVELLDTLIRYGANVNSQVQETSLSPSPEVMNTALHFAVSTGSVNATLILLKYGAEHSVRNKLGNTVLHVAAQNPTHNNQILQLLLERGADPSSRNANGETPRMLAFSRGYYTATNLLQKAEKHSDAQELDDGLQMTINDPSISLVDDIRPWPMTKYLASTFLT